MFHPLRISHPPLKAFHVDVMHPELEKLTLNDVRAFAADLVARYEMASGVGRRSIPWLWECEVWCVWTDLSWTAHMI